MDAAAQVQDWIERSHLRPGDRLPSERALSERLGLSRSEIRKALALFEMRGAVTRHIGRGTFVANGKDGAEDRIADMRSLLENTSPHEAMMARLTLEPELAAMAAVHASQRQLTEARRLCEAMRAANDWPSYESLDSRFHALIAKAAGNSLLGEIHRIVNLVRISVVWARLDVPEDGPPDSYHSFNEHDVILEALERRDGSGARHAMRAHLDSVRATFLQDDAPSNMRAQQ